MINKVNMKELVYLIVLLSLEGLGAPGIQSRSYNETYHPTNRPCSMMDYKFKARCHEKLRLLTCTGGLTNEWLKTDEKKITHLIIQEWAGECFNISRIQHFTELNTLEFLNCTSLKSFKGHLRQGNKIKKLAIHGSTSLHEVPPDVVMQMPELREVDLRSNVLRHLKARFLKGPPKLQRLYISDNKWDCSDGGLDWLAMEKTNSSLKMKIMDYYSVMCHQQLYRGKPLHKVMDIIKTVRQTCPEPCECQMTHVVSDPAGTIIPMITVNCSYKQLKHPPATLPPNTTTLRLEGNKINTIRTMIQNPHYKKLADLYLDNNSISAVKELEGSEWFNTFRVLSLRGNLLKQIPVYAFDKAFQVNNNIMHVFLGQNPWRCDCHYISRFQNLLQKYKRVIRDVQDIRCAVPANKVISHVQINKIPFGHVCSTSAVGMRLSTVNIINLVLALLIILVVGRFLYDWHSFKRSGKLPWISSILP